MGVTVNAAFTWPGVRYSIPARIFWGLIFTLTTARLSLGNNSQYPRDYSSFLKDGDEFDFVIVGGGAAGSIVANRLSKIPKWRILLIEAGGYPPEDTEVPIVQIPSEESGLDWKYQTESSDKHSAWLRNRRCPCPRGKGLGGSTNINAMYYMRSTRGDHKKWTDSGLEGWDYDSVVEYYKSFENVQTRRTGFGKGGDFTITEMNPTARVLLAVKDAYVELGYGEYNEDKPIGHIPGLWTVSDGIRQTAAKAFLTHLDDRKNLYVSLNTHAARLIFNLEKTTVLGVEVYVNNQLRRITAKKEVVLSAGAISSPQILLRSGIGPADHLSEIGIEVVQDLPVGMNLQDHVIYLTYADLTALEVQEATWLESLYGYFVSDPESSTSAGKSIVGVLSSKGDSDSGNIQCTYFAIDQDSADFIPRFLQLFGQPQEIIEALIERNKKSPTMIVMNVLLNPKSKGFVKLRNADPFAPPIIVPNYLSDADDEDLKALLEGLRANEDVLRSQSLAPYSPKWFELAVELCKDKPIRSRSFKECAVRSLSATLFHPVGTCKMGPSGDRSAVVDERLKVHGIVGVRVIDGSIMPTITSSNTNAPITMIGAKGADMLIRDWLNKHDEL